MELFTLKPKHSNKKRKRIGRGGKRGTYSGKGQKGQKSRSGHRLKNASARDIQKMPKLRGLKNKAKTVKPITFRVRDLEKIANGPLVSMGVLYENGSINNRNRSVKILGGGRAKRAFTVDGIAVSKGAREEIERSGGKILS